MCLAVPGKIKEIRGKQVFVQYEKEIREALAGDEKIKIGDWVLVQMGIIIKILSPKEAKISRKSWSNF